MAGYNNFQTDNAKYTKKESRSDYNPDHNSSVSSAGDKESELFDDNLEKYVEFLSWARWYPDLFLDLIKPKTGGINLHADQRVFLRATTRFVAFYGVFPRGYGKTYDEVLSMFVVAVLFPSIELALTAQTKENAAELLKDKYLEIVKHFPWFNIEIYDKKFSKNDAEIVFVNDSRIDILANAQTSKGQRRKRIMIEESALLDNATFEDALQPIVEVGRMTAGELGIINPEELNQQIHFFTTSGFRGSDEYIRSCKMVDDMVDLKGDIVLGSDWHLACWYGRGSSKKQILKKKKNMSPIAFAMNYMSHWVGSVENSLVDIKSLMKIRTLTSPITEPRDNREYYIGVDVARSQDTANNQSSISVIEVERHKNGKVKSYNLVNLINISNALNFTGQAIRVKMIKNQYKAKMVVVDGNGLGSGLVDELMKSQVNPENNEILGCWNTINTDAIPDEDDYENCLYDLKAQSNNTEIIVNFIDCVDSGKLRLLEKKQTSDYNIDDKNEYLTNVLPYVQTDFLIEEVVNLQLEHLPNSKLKIKKLVKKINKDRFSSLSYVLWYIKEYDDFMISTRDELDVFSEYAMFM